MSLHTRNHPHWSEGAWDSPILSPPPSLEDIPTDSSIITDTEDLPEPHLPGLVEVFGGLLGSLFEGIGNILGGVWEAGSAILGPIVDGATNLITGIVNGFRNIFGSLFGGGGGPAPVSQIERLMIQSPIKADLEGALQPHFDRIDESFDEIGTIRDDMQTIRDESSGVLEEVGRISSSLESTNDLIEQKVGEAGEVQGLIADLSAEMNAKFDSGGELETQLASLQRSLEKKIEGDISSAEGSMTSKISALENATEEDYRTLNNRLWGDQGDINKLNNEMWTAQQDINNNYQEFQSDQTKLNTLQDDFNERMTEFTTLQTEFNDDQKGLNAQYEKLFQMDEKYKAEQDERDTKQEEMAKELRDALQTTQDHIVRMLPVPGKTPVNNEHFSVTLASDGNYLVKRKGDWVGEFVWQGVWSNSGQASLEVHKVGIDTEWPVISANYHPSLITYWINEGKADSWHRTRSNWTPPRHNYHAAFTWDTSTETSWTSSDEVNVQVFFRIGWDGATNNDWYGTQIRRVRGNNSVVVGEVIKRTGVGPLFPGQNGYRTMTINEFNIPVRGGDKLVFEAHSSAEWTSQRKVRTAWVEVDYIDPKLTDD